MGFVRSRVKKELTLLEANVMEDRVRVMACGPNLVMWIVIPCAHNDCQWEGGRKEGERGGRT